MTQLVGEMFEPPYRHAQQRLAARAVETVQQHRVDGALRGGDRAQHRVREYRIEPNDVGLGGVVEAHAACRVYTVGDEIDCARSST